MEEWQNGGIERRSNQHSIIPPFDHSAVVQHSAIPPFRH
jgi:hypothetical protein